MNIVKLSFDYTEQKKFLFGLVSDPHIDSPGHDEDRFTNDMDRLANGGARIIGNGDFFDAIMPTDRKRYSRSSDIMGQDAQVNERVDYVFSKLKPYADYIDYMGVGNHEVSIVKYNNVDAMAMLVRDLNKIRSKTLAPIQRGGYCGFVYLHFHRKNESVKRHVIYRTHGVGGNSPVTKGIIQLQRLYGEFDADTYWIGHVHHNLTDHDTNTRSGVSPQGKLYRTSRTGIITAGYQSVFNEVEYGENDYYKVNFPEERFLVPTSVGYGRLEIELTSEEIRSKVSIE